MIKKYYRKLYRAYLGKPMSKDEFDHVLKNLLGLSRGDSVLVHSSFGNLKAGFSPKEAVELLMEIVGQDGNILMPYYPEDSRNWLEQGKVFDVKTTPTRSGILSVTFASFPEVKKSLHPIKSLAVWGKDRDYLISTHHESVTPFDEKSPYYLLSKLHNSKSIGVGVFKNSMVHSAEDVISAYPRYYYQKTYEGQCVDYDGAKTIVKTQVHGETNSVPPCEYLFQTKCPGYSEIKYRKRRFYVSDCKKIITHIQTLTDQGLSATKVAEKQKLNRLLTAKVNRL